MDTLGGKGLMSSWDLFCSKITITVQGSLFYLAESLSSQ